jgi:hypothetical protein
MTSEDRAWAEYSERVSRDVLPKIFNSAVFLSIHKRRPPFDVRQATEIGAALLLGKPMMVAPSEQAHCGHHAINRTGGY